MKTRAKPKLRPTPMGGDETNTTKDDSAAQGSELHESRVNVTGSSVRPIVIIWIALVMVAVGLAAAGAWGYQQLVQQWAASQQTTHLQIQELNATLAELRQQLSPGTEQDYATQSQMDELTRMISQLRTELDQQSATEANALADLESRFASTGVHREQDLRRLAEGITAVEVRMAQLETNNSTTAVATVALARLAQAIQGSQPFVHSLNAYELASGNTVAPFLRIAAMQGLATRLTLANQFHSVAHQALASGNVPEANGGLVSEWRAWLANLVTVRPAGEIAGTTVAARISQASARLAAGNLDAALAALSGLPPNVAESMSEWMAAARLRIAAEAEVSRLLAQALNSDS